MIIITEDDIKKLLSYFAQHNYAANSPDATSTEVLEKCKELLLLDYELITLSNTSGELSANYPRHIFIPDVACDPDSSEMDFSYDIMRDPVQFRELILKSQTARCRSRFPVPVILYRGKYVCRSATLSGTPEVYGRSGINYVLYGSGIVEREEANQAGPSSASSSQSDWNLVQRRRHYDIRLLKALQVKTIVDLMVENKKIKYGLRVSSSEKVDSENRYSDFNIISLPYPGCEFFKLFREFNYSAQMLKFDWDQSYCDATLNVPNNEIVQSLEIEWRDYRTWPLVMMTQNYFKLLLRYLEEHPKSILIHCISGWDRTPLYISMLRLSLWADGVIHKTLNAAQILYLTIGYDWFLFGHQLSSRLNRGEDVFYFCFYMLKHLTRSQYSILGRRGCGHHKRTRSRYQIPQLPLDPSDGSAPDLQSGSVMSMDVSQPSLVAAPVHFQVEPLNLPSDSSEEETTGPTETTGDSESVESWHLISETRSTSSSSGHSTFNNEAESSSESNHTVIAAGSPAYSIHSDNQEAEQVVPEAVCSEDQSGGEGDVAQEVFSETPHSPRPGVEGDSSEPEPTPQGDEEEEEEDDIPELLCRKRRLNEVRRLFNACYSATILRMPGEEPQIIARMGDLAERVGRIEPNDP